MLVNACNVWKQVDLCGTRFYRALFHIRTSSNLQHSSVYLTAPFTTVASLIPTSKYLSRGSLETVAWMLSFRQSLLSLGELP